MVISHNVLAMNANRMLGINTKSKAKSTEKLSSGYRINRAADDAAGLAISEKMRRQIRGLTQASENCQDGVSLCQVADGALNESQDILQRMNELAVKSANGTNATTDREYIQREVELLSEELDRIANNTAFNEKLYPLKGSQINKTNAKQKWKIPSELGEESISFRASKMSGNPITINGVDYPSGSFVTLTGLRYKDDNHILCDGFSFKQPDPPAMGFGEDFPYITNSYLSDLKIEETTGKIYLEPKNPGYWGSSPRYLYYNPDNNILSFYATKVGNVVMYAEKVKENNSENGCFNVEIQAGSESGEMQRIPIYFVDATNRGLELTDPSIDVSTQDGATSAIDRIKNALDKVSSYRSQFGATQNRLEHTIKNLDNIVENTTAAESRIRDTDMAKEMVAFSNLNVLEQAGQAMLAQANQSKQGILSLLQ